MRVPPEFFFGVVDVEEVVMMLHIAFGHDDDYDDMMMIMMMMMMIMMKWWWCCRGCDDAPCSLAGQRAAGLRAGDLHLHRLRLPHRGGLSYGKTENLVIFFYYVKQITKCIQINSYGPYNMEPEEFEALEKRAWNSGFTGGMGKRAWNSGFTGLSLSTLI